MMSFNIRHATMADVDAIHAVYRHAAAPAGDDRPGFLRREDEITEAYIRHNLEHSLRLGVSWLAESAGVCVGELHGWTSETRQLAHVLSNLTIAVDPVAQGLGVGRALFTYLIAGLKTGMPQIRIIELYCRADNMRAIALYRALGFVEEGRLKGRVGLENGTFKDDLLMALHL